MLLRLTRIPSSAHMMRRDATECARGQTLLLGHDFTIIVGDRRAPTLSALLSALATREAVACQERLAIRPGVERLARGPLRDGFKCGFAAPEFERDEPVELLQRLGVAAESFDHAIHRLLRRGDAVDGDKHWCFLSLCDGLILTAATDYAAMIELERTQRPL